MLAKPTKAIGEVLDKFEGKKFTCEYKYDGERAQVNYSLYNVLGEGFLNNRCTGRSTSSPTAPLLCSVAILRT